MDFISCFLCSSTKSVEKTCFILFSLDGVRAIVYNKNSDNKTPCKRSGCGLIKSLLFLFFHKRLSLVLLSPFFCSTLCFCPFLFGKRVFFYPFWENAKNKIACPSSPMAQAIFYMFIVRESFSTADCPQLVRRVQRLSGIGENPVFEKRTKNNLR